MMTIKDMMFHLTELKRENDDLREQIDHHLTQQQWFMQQIDGLQQEYGSCYYHYSLCSLELYNLKEKMMTHPMMTQSWHQDPAECSTPPPLLEEMAPFENKEHLGMLEADVDSYCRERLEKQSVVQALVMTGKEQVKQQQETADKVFQLETLVVHYKAQLSLLSEKTNQFEAEVQSMKTKLTQEKAQCSSVRKKLKEAQDEVGSKEVQVKNQKDTIHRLQNNNIVLTEKLAVTEGMYREAKKEVGVATDLFNEMSSKTAQMQSNHSKTVRELNQTIHSLRATNTKMVHKAVEQAKIIQKLNSSVRVMFQVDKETTAEVMREGYNDLQKFVEQKATQMEHILALVAYALTHLKCVIERYAFERFEGSESMGASVYCDFLNQIVNQITRIFLIIPVPVMARNIDRLTDLAAENCISMKALHMIQYALPESVEAAQASRQRVVLDKFPQLSEFFTTERATNDETVCLSVTGFMLLLGISK